MDIVLRVISRTAEVIGRTLVATAATREKSLRTHTPDRGLNQASPFISSDECQGGGME